MAEKRRDHDQKREDLVEPKPKAPLENEPDNSGIGSDDTSGTGVKGDRSQGKEFDDPSGSTGVKKPVSDSMTKPEMGE